MTELAIGLYQQAAELGLTDSAPLSNLSATRFERGDYSASVRACDRALALLEDQTKQHRLLARKAKCLAHSVKYQDASEILHCISPGEDRADVEQTIQSALKTKKLFRTLGHCERDS